MVGRATDGLINPTLRENWPYEPVTEEHFEAWLAKTKAALLEWLRKSALAAQDKTTKEKIDIYNEQTKARWNALTAPIAFDERGKAFSVTDKKTLLDERPKEKRKSTTLHNKDQTWRKFIEYRYAQASWEDFLYYQNVWNRRHLAGKKEYGETVAEKNAIAARQALRKAAKADDNDTEDEVLPIKANGTPASDSDGEHPNGGTPGQLELARLKGDLEGAFLDPYIEWRNHMIRLYKEFKLAYRKRMPAVIAPDIAHRYSQPPRGTTPQQLYCFRRRHKHLEERFPRRRRRVIDVNEVEEDYRPKSKRQKDNELERKGGMEPITWRIDETEYRSKKLETENESGYNKNPLTLKLLPRGHVQHHGSTETGFDWPTSFESPAWGTTRSVTIIRRDYEYETIPDPEPDNPDASETRKKQTAAFKTDKHGNRIKKTDPTRRYKKEMRMEPKRKFIYDRLRDGDRLLVEGEVVGRDRRGNWRGRFVMADAPVEDDERDAAGNPILLPPRYLSKNTFKIRLDDVGSVGTTRLQRHWVAKETYELSDEEDERCVASNVNFPRSGNMNPDQLGNPWASNIGSDREEGVGYPDDSSDDDESDDEGDLFASSYRECSGTGRCARTKQARLLLESLQKRFVVLASWTVQHIIDFQRDDPGFETVSDKGITEIYATEAGYM